MDIFDDFEQFSTLSTPEHDGQSKREVSTLLGSWLDVIDDRLTRRTIIGKSVNMVGSEVCKKGE